MAGSAVAPVTALSLLLTLALAGCTPPTDIGPRPPEIGGENPPTTPGEGNGGTPEGLKTGYDATRAPHWSHLRMQMTDYRILYLSDPAARSAEYAWTARHFDRIILDWTDTRSVAEYRKLVPSAELYRYVLTWTVVQPSSGLTPHPAVPHYPHMQQWYERHPEYELEDAFLHDATRCSASTKSQECRLAVYIWSTDRWIVNPADAGLRAYQRERLAAIASDADGLFIDEHSSGDMIDRVKPKAILEYPVWSTYERDITQLVRDARAAVGPGKRVLLNTYNYVAPWDLEMTVAAGGAHAEAFNHPVYPDMEKRWRHAEAVVAAGATMNLLPQPGDLPASYTAGNFDTPTARRRMWHLASYYLVAPAQPGLLYFNSIGDYYEQPFAASWLAAVEANIGAPTTARRVYAEGRDGAGQPYRVWARDYQRALVLVRPVIDWSSKAYGDDTAVELTLPASERYWVLGTDGEPGAAVGTVKVRAGEGVILVKG